MRFNKIVTSLLLSAIILAIMLVRGKSFLPFLIPIVFAHCDTLDGPVVSDAKTALEKGDITPVLKWVKKEHEGEIRKAFEKALMERKKSPGAKESADMRFFEALVRIHRQGEGASFTGLKPAGTDLGPAVREADKALESGSVDKLVDLVTEDVASGICKRFIEALEKKKHKDESVEAGREFVEAYVEFVHYVERIDKDAAGKNSHHHAETEEAEGHHEE